jgi:hypothetical protein
VRRRAGALLAALLLAFSAPAAAADPADVAAAYLRDAQLENGLFRYEYNFLTGRWSRKDNVVRQAGTAFALAFYHQQRAHEPTRQAVVRSLTALAARSIPHGEGLLVSEDGSPEKARTGATALALAAAVLAGIDSAPIAAWRDGLLALQRDDGRFARTPLDERPSGYYDGETWMALGLLAARDDDPALAQALARADSGMLRAYGAEVDITFYHWGQLAAATRYAKTGDPALVAFAAGQTQSFLDSARPKVSSNSNSCYSLEGLAAAYVLIATDQRLAPLAQRIAERIQAELAHNLSLQVQREQEAFLLREGAELRLAELPLFAGAFLNARYQMKTRIDSTQHCLAALLQVTTLDLASP